GLCNQSDLSLLKPIDCSLGIEMLKSLTELLFTAGIVFGEKLIVKKGMGYIAAAATGNLYFCQQFAALFQDSDACMWMMFFAGNSCKKACRTPSNNSNVQNFEIQFS